MKFLKFLLVAFGLLTVLYSCTKTDSPIPVSAGSLETNDTTGYCLPSIINGTYITGVPLNSNNYIVVTVNVTSVGTFNISTDSVNGMYFSSVAGQRFGSTGLNQVHLYSHGKPTLPGLTTFTVQYSGTTCTISLLVASVAPGSFTLTDTSGNNISTATVSGTYIAGTPLVSSDSVVMKLNVIKAGLLNLSSNTVDGILFSGAAVFSATGIQTITLYGTGIPQSAGIYNFDVVDSLNDSCKFSVTVVPFGGTAATAASFTLGGSPGGCSGFTQYGSYVAGVKIATADSVTTQVNVTRAGSYSVVTNPVNGVVFSGTGIFDSTGIFTITLHGFGTPTLPGIFNYTAVADSSNCTFSISYGQGAAVYTLGGAPGGCTGFILSGSYINGSPLTLDNTATMQVNVITPGSYTISTPTVNGMQFSGSGIFVNTGLQQITLTGTGTPITYGIFNFAVASPTGNCIFTINVLPPTAIFTYSTYPYGACFGFRLNGTYKGGVPLNSADSAVTQVNVTYTGPYSIVTDTTNGMIFSAQGTFTSTGTQNVTLYGKGTPTTSGASLIIVGTPPNFCSFNINVQ